MATTLVVGATLIVKRQQASDIQKMQKLIYFISKVFYFISKVLSE